MSPFLPNIFEFIVIILISSPFATTSPLNVKDNPQTFRNPIIPSTGDITEPYFYLHTDGYYYYAVQSNSRMSIDVRRSSILTDWSGADSASVFNASEPYQSVGGPEIHFIRGEWLIYFYMCIGTDDLSFRNYVIQAKTGNPLGEYGHAIKLSPHDLDTRAHRGTVLEHHDGQLYFIFTAYPNATSGPNSLYIAPMFSPVELSGPRVLLRAPTKPWEGGHLEGPQILKRGKRLFLLFTANPSSNPCLGIMGLDHKRHPLVTENWWQTGNVDGCIFYANPGQNVYQTRWASFTTSSDHIDGTQQSWIIYTGNSEVDLPLTSVTIRAEQFDWTDDNFPVFPRPAGLSIDHVVPSG